MAANLPSNDTRGNDDENATQDESTSVCPKLSLLTNMLVTGSVSSLAAADPSEDYDSSCAPTPLALCRSGETTLASHSTRQSPVHGTFTSVEEGSKTSISNPSSTLLGMLTNEQSQIAAKPLNVMVNYIGIFPTGTECPSDAKIFQRWEENRSRCEVCLEHCPDRIVYKEHYLLHRSLHIKGEYFKCYQCRRLLNKKDIREHVQIHSGKTAYPCRKCGKSFLYKRSYKIHMAVHNQEEQIHVFKSDLTKHASEHQRKMSKHTGSKRKSDDNVDDSDDEMEGNTIPQKGMKSMKSWRHSERSLPCPEISKKVTTSAVNDIVIKQEVKTEDSEDMDTMADTSVEKRYIRNTSDTIPQCCEEQDGRMADVPFAIKQEPGGVPTDSAEMCVTLPRPLRGDSSEASSSSVNSLCCGDSKPPNNSRQGGDGSIEEQEASEVERIMVSGDAGDEQWIVQKADSDDDDGEMNGTSVKSEPRQDLLPSDIGDVSSIQKSSSVLLSFLMKAGPNQQAGTQVVDVNTEANKEELLPCISKVKDLLFRKLQNPRKNNIVKEHSENKPYKKDKKNILKSAIGCKWTTNVDLSSKIERRVNDKLNDEWIANYFKCPECEEVCETVCIYREHYLFHRSLVNSDGQYVQCCECKTTVQNTYLRKHVRVHSGPFGCGICGEMYTFKSKYDIHIKMHKQRGHKYLCSICQKEFGYEYLLKRHSVTHTKLQCNVCGHTCAEKRALEMHKLSHEARALYFSCGGSDPANPRKRCVTCGKNFVNAESLNKHFKGAHTKLSYKCHICGKMFSKREALLSHKSYAHSLSCEGIDDDEVLYVCSVCNELFQTEVLLQEHFSLKCKLKTTKKKRRKCNKKTDFNGQTEKQTRHVKKSVRKRKKSRGNKKHQHDIPTQSTFQCDVCLEVFKTKYFLQKHSKSAHKPAHKPTDVKPVPCEQCHEIFQDKTNLSIHIKIAHDSEKIIQGQGVEKDP